MSILITRPPALYGVFHTKEWIKRVGRFVKAMQYAVYVLYLINRGQCEDELCPAERLTETCFFKIQIAVQKVYWTVYFNVCAYSLCTNMFKFSRAKSQFSITCGPKFDQPTFLIHPLHSSSANIVPNKKLSFCHKL